MDIGTVLRGLYASEINAGVAWEFGSFQRGELSWWVGNPERPGGCDEAGRVRTFEDAAQAMHEAAIKLYPDSEYAKQAKEATPPVRALTPEMLEAVKDAADFLVESDDKYNNSGPYWGEQLRAAFGIEEATK